MPKCHLQIKGHAKVKGNFHRWSNNFRLLVNLYSSMCYDMYIQSIPYQWTAYVFICKNRTWAKGPMGLFFRGINCHILCSSFRKIATQKVNNFFQGYTVNCFNLTDVLIWRFWRMDKNRQIKYPPKFERISRGFCSLLIFRSVVRSRG